MPTMRTSRPGERTDERVRLERQRAELVNEFIVGPAIGLFLLFSPAARDKPREWISARAAPPRQPSHDRRSARPARPPGAISFQPQGSMRQSSRCRLGVKPWMGAVVYQRFD